MRKSLVIFFFFFPQYFLCKITLMIFFSQMDFNYSIILSTRILPFYGNFGFQDLNISLKLLFATSITSLKLHDWLFPFNLFSYCFASNYILCIFVTTLSDLWFFCQNFLFQVLKSLNVFLKLF